MEAFAMTLPGEMQAMLARVPSLSPFSAVVASTAILAFIQLFRMARRTRRRRALRTTALSCPPNPSFLFGVGKTLAEGREEDHAASMYEAWARAYGGAFFIPTTLGRRRVVLYDARAIAHFSAKETWTYVRTPMVRKSTENGFGRGLLWAEGESHKRQRKSLTPAFSIAAIRNLTPIFYDSAHKAKGAWNALIESSSEDGAIIDVQNWMNYISLDTVGLAGFSHDFGALDGEHTLVTEIFDTFSSSTPAAALNIGLDLLAQVFPFLVSVPTSRGRLFLKLNRAIAEISTALLARTKQELEKGVVSEKEEQSVIGLLIKAESTASELRLSMEEVLAQMKTLLFAGYETTSISMTWALIELSRNPDVQAKLRKELLEYDLDPTFDQLTNGLPYLDAVVHEILRLHAPVRESTRMAAEDDIIPLSEPVRTESGELVESLCIAKGTVVIVPLASVNRSAIMWGKDAKVFKPSRWLEDGNGHNGIPARAREVQGHRHLLTFSDGPRICLGKSFAVTEFKAVLSVLVKNFVFELRDGAETRIEMGRGLLLRPRVAGEAGCKVPLRVKPYVG